jgi:hypothetical protein
MRNESLEEAAAARAPGLVESGRAEAELSHDPFALVWMRELDAVPIGSAGIRLPGAQMLGDLALPVTQPAAGDMGR